MNNNKLLSSPAFWLLLVVVVILFMQSDMYAQCSMCRAAPTSNINSGEKKAAGLNTGILYLMAIPYLLLMAFVLYFFRDKIKSILRLNKKFQY